MDKSTPPDNLEARFLEPEGFRWHSFTRENRTIRFGSVFPKDSIPDAVVVCLPGLSEYGEKYFELAHDILKANLAFWVIDWMGQGASSRYLKNNFKRHSDNFEHDVQDLHKLVMEYIKHSSVHPDKGRIPLAMLGHSMGSNIGLRYLAEYPDHFECAAFSAPLLGIHNVSGYFEPGLLGLAKTLSTLIGTSYGPGQIDWHENMRPYSDHDKFSSDEQRGKIHEAWLKKNPDLQIGGVTYQWIYDALRSCKAAKKALSSITTEILVGIAENDVIVSNSCIQKSFASLQTAKVITLENSQHEILMERDEIRSNFLNEFYALIEKNIIMKPETLRPF